MRWTKCLAILISGILTVSYLWLNEMQYALFFLGIELLLLGGLQDSVGN